MVKADVWWKRSFILELGKPCVLLPPGFLYPFNGHLLSICCIPCLVLGAQQCGKQGWSCPAAVACCSLTNRPDSAAVNNSSLCRLPVVGAAGLSVVGPTWGLSHSCSAMAVGALVGLPRSHVGGEPRPGVAAPRGLLLRPGFLTGGNCEGSRESQVEAPSPFLIQSQCHVVSPLPCSLNGGNHKSLLGSSLLERGAQTHLSLGQWADLTVRPARGMADPPLAAFGKHCLPRALGKLLLSGVTAVTQVSRQIPKLWNHN